MTEISKPDFASAENAAYELLLASQTNQLPIKVKKLVKLFPNLRINSYSSFGKKRNMTIEEVCEFANSDEGCCIYKKSTQKYLILYNDTKYNLGRERWTIAHELGHYILKHNERNHQTIFARNTLSKNKNQIFEQEANCFARELLAPPNLLLALRKFDSRDLVEWCNVSMIAATNILKFYNQGIEMGRIFNPQSKIIQSFSQYIHINNHEKHCPRCTHYFIIPGAVHCPVCNYKRLTRKGAETMIYNSYSLDGNSRALICPRCENEEINGGDFCKICSSPTVNKCTRKEYDRDGDIIGECETLADGNARYCTVCGEKTTYYMEKLFVSWKEEFEEKKAIIEMEKDIPF